jgi:hypothetical protein
MLGWNVANLQYRLSVDGTALSTLIGKSLGKGLSVLLFRTESEICGATFEGSLSAALALNGRFVEMGMAFVFVCDAAGHRIYRKQIGGNTLLYSVASSGISFGGPKPALYVSSDFRNLMSAACETFGSPPLVKDLNVGDPILDAELYSIGGHLSPFRERSTETLPLEREH